MEKTIDGAPYVLIGMGPSGNLVEVGLFDDEGEMRLYAHKNTRTACTYSVWTPRMNATILAVSVGRLSWPKG